mmetsp:Transcript_11965/g.21204  ORF Transcript_11965/g.21204 Transcript_11965/m.21204 type:complete len:242 (-) Transcript_11965:200-925(-)
MRQVRTARTDVAAEDVRSVALVVHAHREGHVLVRDFFDAAPHVDCEAADRREEGVEVRARHELRVHHIGLLEERLAKRSLRASEALGDAREVPHGLDRELGDVRLTVVRQHVTVRGQTTDADGLFALWQIDVRLGDGNGRPDVVALFHVLLERDRRHVAVRIHRDDTLGVVPRVEGPHLDHGGGEVKLGLVLRVEASGGHGKGLVHRVTARMGANGVALGRVTRRRDDRTAFQRRGSAPFD